MANEISAYGQYLGKKFMIIFPVSHFRADQKDWNVINIDVRAKKIFIFMKF